VLIVVDGPLNLSLSSDSLTLMRLFIYMFFLIHVCMCACVCVCVSLFELFKCIIIVIIVIIIMIIMIIKKLNNNQIKTPLRSCIIMVCCSVSCDVCSFKPFICCVCVCLNTRILSFCLSKSLFVNEWVASAFCFGALCVCVCVCVCVYVCDVCV